jgi:hypothetical protein
MAPSESKTWHVTQDPPPEEFTVSMPFHHRSVVHPLMSAQTDIERWLNDFFDPPSHQGLPTNLRAEVEKELNLARTLENEIKPIEWLAQELWIKAGKTGPYEFDVLYVGSAICHREQSKLITHG